MEKIIKTLVHNQENSVYAITVSDKINTQTLRRIFNLLMEEEERIVSEDTSTEPISSQITNNE
jgi:hypothetical protein